GQSRPRAPGVDRFSAFRFRSRRRYAGRFSRRLHYPLTEFRSAMHRHCQKESIRWRQKIRGRAIDFSCRPCFSISGFCVSKPECDPGLVFGAIFWFDCSVSAGPDELTSTIATGTTKQQGGVAFTTTHWSVVLQAQGESPAAQQALEKLCRTYWRPI